MASNTPTEQLTGLFAGAATSDLTPPNGTFLHGYPHVRRLSTGVHDPLFSSALYLESSEVRVMFIANDLVYVSKFSTSNIRRRISEQTGMPAGNILISATHTHSGPKTLDPLCSDADPAIPRTDPKYVAWMEDRVVDAAVRAASNAVRAEVGLAIADGTGVGTNRRDPNGPRDLAVPVMVVRSVADKKPLVAMLVCAMHPTVLHEDSTLVSGDFPGLTRRYLQKNLLGEHCPVLYHNGPAGNQSPRHVVRANTFAEAERLGTLLGQAAEKAIASIKFRSDVAVECRSASVELPLRTFPGELEANAKLEKSVALLKKLRDENAPRAEIRTAECDWFGAQETVTLARAAASGHLQKTAKECMPAEVQVIYVGDWKFVAWPGEMFVEFGLQVKARCPNTFLINYANGELQGYLVTREAVAEGGYESSNAIFASPQGGQMLVDAALALLLK